MAHPQRHNISCKHPLCKCFNGQDPQQNSEHPQNKLACISRDRWKQIVPLMLHSISFTNCPVKVPPHVNPTSSSQPLSVGTGTTGGGWHLLCSDTVRMPIRDEEASSHRHAIHPVQSPPRSSCGVSCPGSGDTQYTCMQAARRSRRQPRYQTTLYYAQRREVSTW